MKKVLLVFLISLYLLGCRAEKSDNTKTNLAILLALSNRSGTTGSRAQLRQASTARTAATTAAKSARSAARASFRMDGKDKKKLMSFFKFHLFSSPKLSYTLPTSALRTSPTAVTCTASGGGACTDSTTSATFSGTANCSTSGTVTLSSLTSTLSGASQDSLEINLTGGDVSFSSCQNDTTDFQNYPATTKSTITSGTLTPRGTYKLTDNLSGTVSTTTTVEDLTINGTVVIGGTSITMTNVRSQTTLTETVDLDKFKFIGANGAALSSADQTAANSGDFSKVFGISASSLVNGTLAVSGNIAGGDASTNQAFSNKTINYRYLCSKNWNDMTDADWSSDTVCTFTIN